MTAAERDPTGLGSDENLLATSFEGRRFLHKDLWAVVQRQLKRRQPDDPGGFYDDLSAMVFASHALEAYINYVGVLLVPELWRNERESFGRGSEYPGFLGKVKKVLQLSGLVVSDQSSGPYASVVELKSLRDDIAHAKTESINRSVSHPANEEPPAAQSEFNRRVTQEIANRCCSDVQAFAQMIHDGAKAKVRDIWFGEEAFGGVSQYVSTSTTSLPLGR